MFNDAMKDANRFYRDPSTGRVFTVDPRTLDKVLVFAWDQEARPFAAHLDVLAELFPVAIHQTSLTEINDALREIANENIVACVLVVSEGALQESSFARVVEVCTDRVLSRQDFRLFVHLIGRVDHSKLLAIAATAKTGVPVQESDKAVIQLVDAVHLADFALTDSSSGLPKAIVEYLTELPEIRRRRSFLHFQRVSIVLMRFVSTLLGLLLLASVVALAFVKPGIGGNKWYPWMFIGLGQCWFLSTLAFVSLPTRLAAGFWLRAVLALAPITLMQLFPWSAVSPHVPYVLAGFSLAAVIDTAGRMLAQASRNVMPIEHRSDGEPASSSPLPGTRRLRFFFFGPLLPQRSRVFISYSESSGWGRAVARTLYSELKKCGISSFFAPASIAPGSSWQHRLQEEIGHSTVFVLVQDALTASKKGWIETEFLAASRQQAIGALPAIIIIRAPDVLPHSLPDDAEPSRGSMAAPSRSERTLFRVIDYQPGVEAELAGSLTNPYNWDAVSVLPVWIAAFVGFLALLVNSLLGTLGVFGSLLGSWGGLVVVAWVKFRGHDWVAWLSDHHFLVPSFLLVAFWIGFVTRLAVGAFFELRVPGAQGAARWRNMELVLFLVSLYVMAPMVTPLMWLFGAIVMALGLIAGCSYFDLLWLGLARRR